MEMLSSSFLGSVMAESLCFLLCVAFLMFKRQKHSAAKPQHATPMQQKVAHGNAKVPRYQKVREVSNNTITRGYLSGESTDTGAGSMRSSDTEASSPEACDTSYYNLLNVISKMSPEDAATVVASLNAAHSLPNTRDASAKSANNWEFTQHCQSKQTSHQQSPAARNTREQAQPQEPKRMIGASVPDSNTLKDNLFEMSKLDPKCVLLVRKIGKLGFNSPQLLEIHFSQFGPIHGVYISPSTEKPNRGQTQRRHRPAGIGFIAMCNADDAAAALQHGGEHVVLGMTFEVDTYEDHSAAQATENPTESRMRWWR